jgi:hypothetical protein
MDATELEAASKYFKCVSLLTDINEGDFVIPRYSLYPFALDQTREILNNGASLINSYEQHLYIADLQNYYPDLEYRTPETWFRLEDVPNDGAFVLKGETNSKKSNWARNMFAADKKAAIEVHSRLCDDALIGQQKIYVRRYIPLVTYANGIGGVPITKEFRFFVAYGQVLTGAYYWQNYVDDLEVAPSVDEVPIQLLHDVIDQVGDDSNFYVIDVAQTQQGDWIVIELNDGQQSGLSCIEPDILYSRLKDVLNKKFPER